MKNDSRIKQPANDNIKNQEKEIERWKATIQPQADHICEIIDKMDYSNAIGSASIVVNAMSKYSDMRTAKEAYASISDLSFDEKVLPYCINVTLNNDYINAQPFTVKYKQNVMYAIQMLVNSFISNAAQFRIREREKGAQGFFKNLREIVDIAFQIVRIGYHKDDVRFKAKLSEDGILQLSLEGDKEDNVLVKEIKDIVSAIKKEKKNILNKQNNTPAKK